MFISEGVEKQLMVYILNGKKYLKLNIQKNRITASSPILWKIEMENWNQ